MTNFTNTDNPKGTSMNREHTAKSKSTPNTGLAAKLSNLFRVQGTGAPALTPAPKGPVRPHAKLLALLVISIAALFATAAPALAANTAGPVTVSEVSYGSAHVTAKGSTGAIFAPWEFQYSSDDGATWKSGPGDTGGKEFDAKGDLQNLKGGTKYLVRLRVESFDGAPEAISPAPYPEFTTLTADPPIVEQTDNAAEVKYTTASVSGKVNRPAKSNDLTCNFEYITDKAFNDNPSGEEFLGAAQAPCETNPPSAPGVITAPGSNPVSAKLTGLTNATTYHLRIAVSGAGGADAKEAASTFTTLTVDPPTVVSIENAGEVEYTQAKVKGVVERPATSPDPAFDVTCNFEYVTDQQFNENPPGEEFLGATPVACEPIAKPDENPITATGQRPVKATLTGLLPSTTYHLRLSASNQGGSDAKAAASTFTTAGPVPKPAVLATDDASEISYRSVKVSGEVERPAGNDPALDIFGCRFEYITDQQFDDNVAATLPGFEGAEQAQCPQLEAGPITSAGPTQINVTLTRLKSGVTYHLRLTAENSGGTDNEAAANTFTTIPGGEPTFTFDPNPVAGPTKVRLTATVTPGLGWQHPGTNAVFEYAELGTENWCGCGGINYVRLPKEFGTQQVSRVISGLSADTDYEFRMLVEQYEGGDRILTDFNPGPNPTAKTGHLEAPTATIDPVTTVTGTTAHFSGTVDTNAPAGPLNDLEKEAYKTEWHFECSPECQDANGNVIGGTVEAEEGSKAVAGDAKRLDSNTHYDVKLVAHNELYSVETPVESFDTPLIKPTVKALPGGSDGEGGYTLAGIVNPNHSAVSKCEFRWGPNSAAYAFKADCSPPPGAGAKPVTVEAHLTSLEPGSVYHFKLFATNAAGEEESNPDLEFTPTLATKEPCPANEQLRKENSSLALPECRAYELVTPMGKEGFGATLRYADFRGTYDGGERVAYWSRAANLAKSGQGAGANRYVAQRTAAGWQTIPDLNGSSGSFHDAPTNAEGFPDNIAYSQDLLSSVWQIRRQDEFRAELRSPDGTFALIGLEPSEAKPIPVAASADLSHLLVWGWRGTPSIWGPGVYEFLGTGMAQPRRVDLDNSGTPISTCLGTGLTAGANAVLLSLSSDAGTIVNRVLGGCGGSNPPADQLWARVNGTTAVDVSASHCTRLDCNAPANAAFQGAASDGSRVFFTTTQQLVDEDTDQTNDLYACDIPSNPLPTADKANPCSAFRQISVAAGGAAEVESVFATPPAGELTNGPIATGRYPGVSADGSTVLFTAKGVLADNEDALGEKALAGDHNLYLWHATDDNPDGQTTFLARLEKDDLGSPQITADGRFLVFTTASQLLDTDTDSARDVYRYDVDAEDLTRVSTNVFGVAGNGDFDAKISGAVEHNPTTAISDDGSKIVFTTTEPLKLAVDNNDQPDVYLWTPDRVSLITTGSVIPKFDGVEGMEAVIDGSGQNIYFTTTQQLTPADGDDSGDVYDARVGGGFSFAQPPICSGETCQPPASGPLAAPAPATAQPPPDPGNVKPKTCPKGKALKGKKCVKKNKKHHKKSHKKAGHNRGGSK